MRKLIGWSLTVLGILMVLAAAGITASYLRTQAQAGDRAAQVMDTLLQQLPTRPAEAPTEGTASLPPAETLRPMAETVIDGVAYIGYVEIPTLGLTLPVISQSTEANLDIAPCRYYGSVFQNNLVIGGHSYARHFGYISSLRYGDAVIFTDVEGNTYRYTVADMERLQPYEGEYLCSGEWELSLYTCTTGGGARIVVRCTQDQ